MFEKRQQSLIEEIFNAIVHGIGALLSIAGLVLLIVFATLKGSMIHVISVSIYGSTLVLLYLNSTIYHSLTNRKAKEVFEIFDHASIYLLIAGTYTPFTLIVLHGAMGWIVFGIIWGLAFCGVLFKSFFTGKLDFISTIIYLIMGWLIVLVFKPLMYSLNTTGLIFLIIGGLLYSVGTIFYLFQKIKFAHVVWHVLVLVATIFHFFAILFYVIPVK